MVNLEKTLTWTTFQLIESQIVHVVHQNPWPCFRSQNEIDTPMSEIIPRPPLEGGIKSKDPEGWQCFMPSGGSAQKRRRKLGKEKGKQTVVE